MNSNIKKRQTGRKIFIFFSISIFLVTFVSITYIEKYNVYRNILIVINAIIIMVFFIRNKYIFSFEKFDVILISFVIYVFLDSFQYNGITNVFSNFSMTLIYCLTIIELLFFIKIGFYFNNRFLIMKVFFWTCFVILLINDYMIFTGITSSLDTGVVFFIGDKFFVSRIHLLLLIMFLDTTYYKNYQHNPVVNILLITYFIYGIYLCLYVDCKTGIIEFIIFLFLFCLNILKIHVSHNRIFLYFIFILSATFFLYYKYLMKIPIIETIVTDLLDRSTSLTGRSNIYLQANALLNMRFMFGFGYNTSYEVTMSLIDYPNLQNALLNFVLELGFVGMLFLVALFVLSIKRAKNSSTSLYYYLVVLIITGTVEITYNIAFIGVLIILFYDGKYSLKGYILPNIKLQQQIKSNSATR